MEKTNMERMAFLRSVVAKHHSACCNKNLCDRFRDLFGILLLVLFLSLIGNAAEAQEEARQLNHIEMNKCVKGFDTGQSGMCAKLPMEDDGIVRLSKIEVYPEYLDEYMKYAAEVGEVSLRTEPGVLTMYALSEKENPCNITILETYSSKSAYERHIASEHFQKYKKGTLHMVKNLILSDQLPLNPRNRIINFVQE